MKKYNLRCNYCGSDHYTSYFFLMLRLLVCGEVSYVCSDCGNMSVYILVSHIVHNTVSVNEKEQKKRFDNAKKELYRRG